VKDGSGLPWFVARKHLASNTLWVVQGHDHPWLLADRLVATSPAWAGAPPRPGQRLSARTRYRQADAGCQVETCDERHFSLRFDRPQRAATPGQSAVLYDGETCLGGGFIDHASARDEVRNGTCSRDSVSLG
jgi:tRNA-specific 2-thiouridylase